MTASPEARRLWIERKRAAGLCDKCKLPAADGKRQCARHLKEVSDRQIAKRRALGIGPRRAPTRLDLIRTWVKQRAWCAIRPSIGIGFEILPDVGEFLRDVDIRRTRYPQAVGYGDEPSRDYHHGPRTPGSRMRLVKFIADEFRLDRFLGLTRVVAFEVLPDAGRIRAAYPTRARLAALMPLARAFDEVP